MPTVIIDGEEYVPKASLVSVRVKSFSEVNQLSDENSALEIVRVDYESLLIQAAQNSVSDCSWSIGQVAAVWTRKFARGRTDADLAALLGLDADQVYQRRRVWELFADVYRNYPKLRWSHFYAALNWDDWLECLTWANDVEAGVAEMKAWRRAQRGEDLSVIAKDMADAPLDQKKLF